MVAYLRRPLGTTSWLGLPVLAVAALALFPTQGGPTVCPFALLTGLGCPGCGLTRAAAALVRGDLMAAWDFHPLILVATAWAVATWAIGLLRRRGRPIQIPPQVVNRLLSMTGLVFVVTWLIRLVSGTLPPV